MAMTESRPEPVTRAGTIAGAVAALILIVGGLARTLGWLTDDLDVNAVATQASNLILGAGALWATLAPLALAWHARSKVTPVSSPVDAFGRVLQAVEDNEPTIAQLWDYLEEILQPAAVEPVPVLAVDPLPTTEMRLGLPPVPDAPPESTPIGDAALTDTLPAAAVRG